MKYVSIREASQILGVSDSTLRNWDRVGVLVPERRLHSGKRFYSVDQLDKMIAEMERISGVIK